MSQTSKSKWQSIVVKGNRPLIGITSDLMIRKDRPTAYLTMTYANGVLAGGGVPVVLPPMSTGTDELIARLDGFILSGGDDPMTESFGHPTHSCTTPVLDARQQFETQLIAKLVKHPEIPVLGICLGMQMMALCSGGVLNQCLPETHDTHGIHWGDEHQIESDDEQIYQSGIVWSKHRQAVQDSGSLRVLARSADGVIEAVDDPNRRFFRGVQWHPERTSGYELGQGVIDQLVQAAKER